MYTMLASCLDTVPRVVLIRRLTCWNRGLADSQAEDAIYISYGS